MPGRVARMDGESGLVLTPGGMTRAEPSRALLDAGGESIPAVGDFVVVQARPTHATDAIEAILPRRSALMRRRSGRKSEDVAEAQVLAANVDVVFVVAPAPDPNPRRIEREVAQVWESGATPVVVLSKADLVAEPGTAVAEVEAVTPGVRVLLTSGKSGAGVDELRAYASDISAGSPTLAFIGPSGVGKSTLVNRLLGSDVQATAEVRAVDGRGRHTTTARHLLPLPEGGALIDTPGLRAFALFEAEAGVSQAFADVEEFAAACRFRDCAHAGEPGCAVLAAIDAGELARERLAAYQTLHRELDREAEKTDKLAQLEKKRRNKRFGKIVREAQRERRR